MELINHYQINPKGKILILLSSNQGFMQFEFYQPSGFLKNFIHSITYLHGDGTGAAFQRVYQTIIFNLGANFYISPLYDRTAPGVENVSNVWINGKQDIPIMVENRGSTKMYVVGIQGGMLPYLTNLSADTTNNQATSAAVWGDPEIFTLHEELMTSDVQHGFERIDFYFSRRLAKTNLQDIDRLRWLNEAIHTDTIESICQSLGITRKKLREDTLYHYGASAKNLQGMIRFNKTLASIAHHSDKSLSEIDAFYDQAHFSKDFKNRTGMTPLQYKRLCQQYNFIKHTPNFIALKKETFLQFISAHPQ